MSFGRRRVMEYHRWLLVVLWCLGLASGSLNNQDTERVQLSVPEILLKIFSQTNGFRWNSHDLWLSDDVCSYEGLTCYDDDYPDTRRFGHVRELNLAARNLVGDLPSEVFELPYLEILVLRENPELRISLTGLGHAQYLKTLEISNTGVESLEGLDQASPNLEVLHISDLHALTDRNGLPAEVLALDNLRALFASDNDFTGPLATEIGNLFYLLELNLKDNQLTGAVPSEIGNLVNLQSLNLANNNFRGNLPTELENCVDLRALILSRDDPWIHDDDPLGLTGPVPALAGMGDLVQVFLQHQKFSGPLPDNFLESAPNSKVVVVDLTGNRVTGPLPLETLEKKNRLSLYLTDNQFQGAIDPQDSTCASVSQWMGGAVGRLGCDAFLCPPGTFGDPDGRQTDADQPCQSCSSAEYFGASSCATVVHSSGAAVTNEVEVLREFYQAVGGQYWKSSENWLNLDSAESPCNWLGVECDSNEQVTAVRLPNNDLTGRVPASFFSLPRLTTLDLSFNSINFSFQGISQASSLQELDLTQTDLETLDDIDELASTTIRKLHLASNSLRESNIPASLFSLAGLDELDLSHNRFEGSLGPQVGSWTLLTKLNLAGNRLTGALPTQIGLLTRLEEFKASGNQFSGFLPTQLNRLTNLRVLQLRQSGSSSGGIGGPLLPLPSLAQLTSLHLDGNSITGTLPPNLLENTERGADTLIELLLADNDISGEIPADWAVRFEQLILDLTGNQITNIDDVICGKTEWMNGDVASHGCDAILCPISKYNEWGRQSTSDHICRDCSSASFMGTKTCSANGGPTAKEDEAAILREFYDATHGQDWTNSDGWFTSSDVCSWYGLSCGSSGQVQTVDLPNNGLEGSPLPSLWDLPDLRQIDLGQNSLTVTKEFLENIPTTLAQLDLSSTHLNSVDGLQGATGLTDLRLDDNDLAGGFPTQLLGLTSLRHLSVSSNQLEGRLPDFSRMTALEELFLYHNRFDGALPGSISKLSSLQMLGLSGNDFEGTIPKEFNDLTKLRTLAIQRDGTENGRGLVGPVPAFDKLSSLSQLFLAANSLSGALPTNFLGGIENRENPIEVDLRSNRLTGGIPASLARLGSLTLYLAGNRLTQEIPDGVCRRGGWMKGQVAIFDCAAILCPPNTSSKFGRQADTRSDCASCPDGFVAPFFGSVHCMDPNEQNAHTEREILSEFFQATQGDRWIVQDGWLDANLHVCDWYGISCTSDDLVQSIQLPQNGLVGPVPSSLFNLQNLKELDLAINNIEIFFDSLAAASKLEFLNLDRTGLETLSGISSAPALLLLHVVGNALTEFPTDLLSMPTLQVVYLSENYFPSLPQDFGQLQGLVGFTCARCGLKGQIPDAIGTLLSLEYLDLSDNELTGETPSTVESLTALKHLDLSGQATTDTVGLTGPLRSFAAMPDLRQLFLQGNALTGPIPSDFLSSVDADLHIDIDLRFNRLNGVLPSMLSRFTDATFYAAANLFTGIDPSLCSLSWNNLMVTPSDCDHILCSAGTYNGLGRATGDFPCVSCSEAPDPNLFGTTFCVAGEREVLQQLYLDLNGKRWVHADGWGSDDNICTWYGVTCHEGALRPDTIRTLDLSNNNLEGTLSDNVWMLTEMISLDLSDNKITVKSLANAGEASSLQTLKLSQNNVLSLAGIGGADSLTSLHCTNCNIQGQLPDDFWNLRNMREIYLNYNNITGAVSSSIGQMRFLEEIHLVHNRLNGTLPRELGFLLFMEVLAIGNNYLTGEIPLLLSGSPSLRILALDNERPRDLPEFGVVAAGFRGDLPSFVGCRDIREIYLSFNSIGGTIPPNFLINADKDATITVDLTDNLIRSEIPRELAEFSDLRLFIAGNRINGIAPEVCARGEWMNGLLAGNCDALLCPPGTFNSYGRRTASEECLPCDHRDMANYYGSNFCDAILPSNRTEASILEEIYGRAGGAEWNDNTNWLDSGVSICDWYGVVCDPAASRDTVVALALGNNNLRGRLGSIVFHLPNLQRLDVSSNLVEITFRDIKDAEKLQLIDVSATLVMSAEGLESAPALTSLNLANNAFFGQTIPSEIYELTHLATLDISDSGFVGEISEDLAGLTDLTSFSASANDITGEIPDVFDSLTSLKDLDLSDNTFHGEIPASLGTVSSLQSLDLSGRDSSRVGLSGPLPSFSSSPMLGFIDLGSNSLTGSVPEDLLATSTANNITVRLGSNLIHGVVPGSLKNLDNLVIDLGDNEIEGIDPELCDGTTPSTLVGEFGCAGLLCPIGTFNKDGRQTSADNPCMECPGERSTFLGRTFCASISKAQAKQILEAIFHATGGESWKKRDGWLTHPDICEWHGITCKDETFVETLNLGSNNLINTPPKTIFNVEGLKNLWLYSNPIEFEFEGIENAKDLRNLQLDSTGLRTLDGVGKAASLKYLDVRFNTLDGTLGTEIEQLHDLETLLIAENKLFGSIPSFVGNRRLSILRAGGNGFVGEIPSLAIHPLMKTLDLADNQFHGTIPNDLLNAADTSKAILIDLSNNKLTGTVPATLSRFDDLTLYLHDNELSGIAPELCGESDWNQGSVGSFGCDGLLCPPQTHSQTGRASTELGGCESCPNNVFFGQSVCRGSSALQRSMGAALLVGMLTTSLMLLLS